MRYTYIIRDDCTIRRRKYKRGDTYTPESPEDIEQLFAMHMIRRARAPNHTHREVPRHGRHHGV